MVRRVRGLSAVGRRTDIRRPPRLPWLNLLRILTHSCAASPYYLSLCPYVGLLHQLRLKLSPHDNYASNSTLDSKFK